MDEVKEILLNGMSLGHFTGMFLCALAGVLVFFMMQVQNSIKNDKRTPDKFSFKYLLLTSGPRIVIGFICIWAAIAYYGELSVKLLNATEPLQITGLISFLMGFGIDSLIKGILELGKNSTKLVQKAVNNT
jgi:hypothetical protein